MIEVYRTSTFDKWFNKLRDLQAKSSIYVRINRLRLGNFGDCEAVGSGVFEMRIHIGKGYRVYFMNTGKNIVLLLCGGSKSTQQTDIERAKELAKDF